MDEFLGVPRGNGTSVSERSGIALGSTDTTHITRVLSVPLRRPGLFGLLELFFLSS